MRVTNQLITTNAINEHRRNMSNIQNLNNQLGGLKIQNGFENSSIFVDGMRLNYEIETLEQVKTSSSKAKTFAQNTDKAMNQFKEQIEQFKKKLVFAANEVHSKTSLDALASELQAIRNHLKDIANTSINGNFIFSGTAVNTRPISDDGVYHGNDQEIKAIVGSKVNITYNLNGTDLFLGSDNEYKKQITSNIRMKYQAPESEISDIIPNKYINKESTIKQLVGDYEAKSMFYLQGKRPNGEAFTSRFAIDSDSKVEDLLTRIGVEYGNDPKGGNDVVEVGMSNYGQIYVKDLRGGNNQIEFNLVAATDKDSNLKKDDIGYAKFDRLYPTPYPPVPIPHDATKLPVDPPETDGFYIKNEDGTTTNVTLSGNSREPDVKFTYFMKSNFQTPDEISTDGRKDTPSYSYYTKFEKQQNRLISNDLQQNAGSLTNAVESTKLIDVAYTPDEQAAGSTMVGQTLNLRVKAIDKNPKDAIFPPEYDVVINLADPASTADITNKKTGITTQINLSGANMTADNITYKQINELISMVASDNIPASNSAADYNAALDESKKYVSVEINSGRITLKDKKNEQTDINLRLTSIVPKKEDIPTSYDIARFKKDGDELKGNVSQVVKATNKFATDSTKLIEVAGLDAVAEDFTPKPSLDGKMLVLKVHSKAGKDYTVRLDFDSTITPGVPPTIPPSVPPSIPPQGGSTITIYEGDIQIPIVLEATVPPAPPAVMPSPIVKSQIYKDSDPNVHYYKGDPTKSDEVTYRQVNDIIGMLTSDNIPKGALVTPAPTTPDPLYEAPTFEEYNKAIELSRGSVEVELDYKGRINILDKQNSKTNIEFSMYDGTYTGTGTATDPYVRNSSGTFSETEKRVGVLSFNANNALILEEPNVDIFKELDEMISAVKQGRLRADGDSDDPRNIGIQGGLQKIDHIADHFTKQQTKIGAHTNALTSANERAELLSVNVQSIKSEIIDADYGETMLKFMQHMVAYQAMLSSTSKINSLSLVNYM